MASHADLRHEHELHGAAGRVSVSGEVGGKQNGSPVDDSDGGVAAGVQEASQMTSDLY